MSEAARRFDTPIVINEHHDLTKFDCGEDVLGEWLRKRALPNLYLGASRTYVVSLRDSKEVVVRSRMAHGLPDRRSTGCWCRGSSTSSAKTVR